ncbi:O-antigen ligase family protein [Halomonas sp. G15]|uniref:O-antigen ligase family protein n=1 Tax=Halomonas sp. G15 TaxID=2903521 RepID=UPI001E29D114|nr:O-antigen ligase family protein [Halomonas sp. G15]MCE0733808.1 O-antigen ligase family protein [Halomonas sp. G15]
MLSNFRPAGWEIPKVWWYIGIVSMGVSALLRLPVPEIGEFSGILLTFVGLVTLLVYGKEFRRSAPLWLLWVALVVQLITWLLGYFHHPEWLPDYPKLTRLAKSFVFIAVAWWLGGSTRATLLIWGLALAGVLIATLLPSAINDWRLGLLGRRVDFNIHNAQHISMFLGAGLIGLLSFSQLCLKAGKWSWLRRAGWGVGVLLCLAGVIFTQTRASWLALAIVLPLMGLVWAVWKLKAGPEVRISRAFIVTGLIGTMLGMGVLFTFHDTISKRLIHESGVVTQLLEGDIDDMPLTSVGVRVVSWQASLSWIAERPVVGWGDDAGSLVMRQTEGFPPKLKAFGHLHNSFLELLVSYGLLGLAVFVALGWWVARGTWRAWRNGYMPGNMALFGYSFFIFWLVVNSFESFIFYWTGIHLFSLVMGGLVTHIWLSEQAGNRKENSS